MAFLPYFRKLRNLLRDVELLQIDFPFLSRSTFREIRFLFAFLRNLVYNSRLRKMINYPTEKIFREINYLGLGTAIKSGCFHVILSKMCAREFS